jgi:AraC-like DNA-binding protein
MSNLRCPCGLRCASRLQSNAGARVDVLIESFGPADARSWSLDDLARTAGISRAGFALRFKQWIGVTPMEYVTQWRMQIACQLLQEGDGRIAEVASAVGYESESALSVAFTRIVGCRPGHYRRRGPEAVKAGAAE